MASRYDLQGKTLRVYKYLLKHREPVGVRQVQRELGFSSPSLAAYHLERLVEMGLASKEGTGYVVEKVAYEQWVRFFRFLVPKQVFYLFFSILSLINLLLFFTPQNPVPLYLYALVITGTMSAVFFYETLLSYLEIRKI